jgi:hypothetical protein
MPIYRLEWRDADVAADISPYLVQIECVDNLHGQADELSITLEDSRRIFSTTFFPKLGDDFRLWVGYDTGGLQGLRYCGNFFADEIRFHGPPDQMTVRALSSQNKAPTRQRGSKTWTKAKLRDVLQATAKASGVTLKGQVPEISLDRVTRDNETPMEFMCRLSEEWGCVFKATGNEVVVSPLADALGADPIFTVSRADVRDYDLTSKSSNVARGAVVRRWNPEIKDKILTTAKRRDPVASAKEPVPSTKKFMTTFLAGDGAQDVAVISERVEDYAQAEVRATARMLHESMKTAQGSISMMGDPRVRAGAILRLVGFGAQDGKYAAVRVMHRIQRGSGFETSVDLMATPF